MPPAQGIPTPRTVDAPSSLTRRQTHPRSSASLPRKRSLHSIPRSPLSSTQRRIRRTSTAMENSSHHNEEIGRSRHNMNRSGYRHTALGVTSVHMESSYNDTGRWRHTTLGIASEWFSVSEYQSDTEGGYVASESKADMKQGDSEGYESTSSHGSRSSLDRSNNSRKGGRHLLKKRGYKVQEVKPVVVANFQPVIEPLERLEFNPQDVFEPLLEACPVGDLEGKESLGLTDAEREGEFRAIVNWFDASIIVAYILDDKGNVLAAGSIDDMDMGHYFPDSQQQ